MYIGSKWILCSKLSDFTSRLFRRKLIFDINEKIVCDVFVFFSHQRN